MDHTSVHVFTGAIRIGQSIWPGSISVHAQDGSRHIAYFVDTGLSISGQITENSYPASNTRVVLLAARSMQAVDVLGRVTGANYQFRSVPPADLGYYVMGIDLDSVFAPVCQGPLQPIAV